ncbi:MAG: hypothetical protein Q8Q09_12380 [Deltaproteobacteria bacterium]|nr:hypothetical protein [Deltaproteobacteria bacterium]
MVSTACGPARDDPFQRRDGSATDATGDITRVDVTNTPDSAGCPTGATRCGTACVNLQMSNQHCGMCNSACNNPQTCQSGVCSGPMMMCPAGQMSCGGACVDTQANSNHCGACGQMCAAGMSCQAGACRAGGCAAPQIMCSGTCTNTNTDARNCGRCGASCSAGQTCSAGMCTGGGSMCIDPCSSNDQCQGSCGAAAAGTVWCCSPGAGGAGGVCFAQSGSSCGGSSGGDGGSSGGDGGLDLLGCLLGTVTCASAADCASRCPGIAPNCNGSGRCE